MRAITFIADDDVRPYWTQSSDARSCFTNIR